MTRLFFLYTNQILRTVFCVFKIPSSRYGKLHHTFRPLEHKNRKAMKRVHWALVFILTGTVVWAAVRHPGPEVMPHPRPQYDQIHKILTTASVPAAVEVPDGPDRFRCKMILLDYPACSE
jgi:hypothetical protein